MKKEDFYSVEAISKIYLDCLVLDSFLKKVDIDFEESRIYLYLDKSGKKVTLVFSGVKDILLNEIDGKEFCITHFKLFYQEERYYFSFSPYSEECAVDERDNNVICSSEFRVELQSL